MSRRYIVVTPVRNEQEFLPSTIRSMGAQTIPPSCWAIVDDGSSDGTPAIIKDAEERLPYVLGVNRGDRGYRLSGSGVVDAFYEGYEKIRESGWDYLVKLDGDLSFGPDYFAQCIARFEADPKLGIGGGTICTNKTGTLVAESRDPAFHVRGAVKMYRRECWEAIGGLVKGPCWDSIDELKANMLGWQTRTFGDLKVLHHRPAGQAFGRWKDWVKGGKGNYVTGYHPLFMLAKCLSRVPRKPVGVAACGLFWGYISSYLRTTPRLVDAQLMKFIRSEQLRFLLGKGSLWSRH